MRALSLESLTNHMQEIVVGCLLKVSVSVHT